MRVRSIASRFVSLRLLLVTAVIFALGSGTAIAAGSLWEVGSATGALVRSNGGTAYTRLSTGTYQADFNSDQTKCAYVATPGDTGAGAVAGPVIATVASRAGDPKGLFIQTFNQSSSAVVDDPVHVATYCGKGFWAVVGGDGTLARGSKVASSAHLSTGNYEVIFTKKVKKCAFTASIGTTGIGSAAAAEITVAGRAGNQFGVFVHTMNAAGTPVDSAFHLAVTCSKDIAVIEADGSKARGSHVTSSTKLGGSGTGTYEVIFDRTVSGCAYTATVGVSTFGGSVSTPVTITTATRAGNPNGVFVFIHKTDGTTIDEPFHLQVSC
ncbi:MAG TPA: hypothetical protein VEM41_13570 [Actinomycetota bacterium]|nr:hypothetical protein [Actinomycetota bacterium]